MNGSISKNNERRGWFDWLLKDWVWEVVLVLLVVPVAIDTFLSIGGRTNV